MSEAPAETPTSADDPTGSDPNPKSTSAQEIDWKAKARDWEKRAKENKTAADELAQIKESQKTETQRLQDQLAEFQRKAETAERDRERLSIIAKHAIPADYHDLVQGADSEALEASAAKVKSLIEANATPSNTASFVIPDEGGNPNLALNGDGIEAALKNALGIN